MLRLMRLIWLPSARVEVLLLPHQCTATPWHGDLPGPQQYCASKLCPCPTSQPMLLLGKVQGVSGCFPAMGPGLAVGDRLETSMAG